MKKVLITGASGGIGLEVARLMAAKNYQITLVARSADKLDKEVTALPGSGHSKMAADLTAINMMEQLSPGCNDSYNRACEKVGLKRPVFYCYSHII